MKTDRVSNDLEGQILQSGKYTWKLGRCLGKGTCSVVVEACGTSFSELKQKISCIKGAIKIFKEGQQFEVAVANEIEMLEHLKSQRDSHSGGKCFIVQLLDYFSYKGQKFLAFERLSCTLHHILLKNSNKGLPLFIIKECACHVLSGLDFLTTHKVVHGDIKMSNIMWNADEGAFQLVDFGFSFHEGNQPYQPFQSPGYRSPEGQVWNRLLHNGCADQCDSRCGCASDMWSFGYVLWYLYTGQPASRFETDHQVCETCLKKEGTHYCMHFRKFQSDRPMDEREITSVQHQLFLDLIERMIKCRNEDRITPSLALQHSFLDIAEATRSRLSDMMLLPTTTLLLENIYPQNDRDCMEHVKEMCASFGVVRRLVRGCDGKVLVEYTDADNCSHAHRALTGLVFNNWTVITSYFPTGKTSMPGIFSPVLPAEHSGLGCDERKEDPPRKRSRHSSTERYEET